MNPLTRALIWIGVYIVSLSTADSMSVQFGIEKLITAPAALLLCTVLYLTIRKEQTHYGLTAVKRFSCRRLLYFIPFALLASVNLWHGVHISHTVLEIALHIISMCCVGFLEEIIFRGLLFRAIERDGIMQAIIICGVTFGIGHIVNLLNGAEFFPTLLQVCYAVAAGLCFTAFFYRTGSLIPCILCHAAINSLSIFAGEPSSGMQIVSSLFLIAVSIGYFFYLMKLKSAFEE